MKKPEKSLQKLTVSKSKVLSLLKLKTITLDNLKILNKKEQVFFFELVTQKMNTLKGEEKDKLWEKIEGIAADSTKNQLWESNHNQITWAIATLLQDLNRMPTKAEIAHKTELSRQTIHKHLKEYATHPQFIFQIEQFKFMGAKVLAKLFKYAVNGDVKAAKLYFEIIGNNFSQSKGNTLIQTQNNYIQINGMVLSQENLKQLQPEQLTQLEELVKTALIKPVKP